jgi:cytochrome P450
VKTFSEGATMVHSTRDKGELREEVTAALQEFDASFLKPSIARRTALLERQARGEIADTALPRDVLTVLLQNEDQLELPPDLVCREIAFYLQAGSHSTANSTVHAMHDIFTWIQTHPEDRTRMISDPLFLQRCVHESLRLHPASPVAWRKPVCPVVLSGGAAVDTEDRVEIDLWAANRSRDAFGEDADVFNPFRKVAAGNEPFGLTFGTGVHTCLGRDLDGGIVPKGAVDPAQHQYGIIALLCKALLEAGATPDPRHPAAAATHTARPNWGSYPVLLR